MTKTFRRFILYLLRGRRPLLGIPVKERTSTEPGSAQTSYGTATDIQQAIDELPPTGGTIPLEGTYIIDKTIRLPSNVHIHGPSNGFASIILRENAGCHIFTNADVHAGNTNIRISRLLIDGNGDRQPKTGSASGLPQSPLYCAAGYFRKVRDLQISVVHAKNIRQTAFHFTGCLNVYVSQTVTSLCGWSGISTSGTSNIVVTDTEISYCGLDMHSGIHLDGGSGAYLSVDVDQCTGNAIMLDSRFAPLRNVVVKGSGTRSKRGLSLSGSGEKPLSNVLASGRFTDNREAGILVSNACDIVIFDADVMNNLGQGILLQGRNGAVRTIISDCRILANAMAIEEIHQSKDNYFAGIHQDANKRQSNYKGDKDDLLLNDRVFLRYNQDSENPRPGNQI